MRSNKDIIKINELEEKIRQLNVQLAEEKQFNERLRLEKESLEKRNDQLMDEVIKGDQVIRTYEARMKKSNKILDALHHATMKFASDDRTIGGK